MAIREVTFHDIIPGFGEVRPMAHLSNSIQDDSELAILAEMLDWRYIFTGVITKTGSKPLVYYGDGPSHGRFKKAIETEVGTLADLHWMKGQLYFERYTKNAPFYHLYVFEGPINIDLTAHELHHAEANMSRIMRGINPRFIQLNDFLATLNDGYRYRYVPSLGRFQMLHQPDSEVT